MKAALTSRERVARMFDRRDHDRVPRFETCWDETLDRWMKEGLPGVTRAEAMAHVLERLQADLAHLCWYWPHPFPQRNEVLSEDENTRVTLGPSGTIERYWKNKSGTPEHLGWECENRDVWKNRYKPAIENQPVQIDIPAVEQRLASAARSGKWTYLAGVSAFEVLRKILGDEAFMLNLVDDPELIADISRVATDNLLLNYRAVLDAGIRPDGLWIFDDMAFNTMTFCSPRMYREIIWPEHRRIVEFGHANGMKVIFHSDGDLRGVVPDLIDAGFDCLQPLESKAGMDIRKLAPQYGGKLAFFGNMDVMKFLTNDLELIEEEVSSKLAAGMECKGYIFHSDHSVPPQVSWETYQAVIEMVDKYGMY